VGSLWFLMKKEEINELLNHGKFPCSCTDRALIETHISWVIVCNEHVFKIKKPLQYSFLDFSTIEKRGYYCKQEVILNNRLPGGIYLGTVPVVKYKGRFVISRLPQGPVVDHAVMMKRIDGQKRMDIMLKSDKVTESHIADIVKTLVRFHQHTERIYNRDHFGVQHDFDDIGAERNYLYDLLGKNAADIIGKALKRSSDFINAHSHVVERRSRQGFVRDCHGDLHSRNIFLCKEPIIFDCIEFNPEIRQIDILSELAFFCMDMEAFGFGHFGRIFITRYNDLFEVMPGEEEERLFLYYKAYRANVRAKVNALRTKGALGRQLKKAKSECRKYLQLMHGYMDQLDKHGLRNHRFK